MISENDSAVQVIVNALGSHSFDPDEFEFPLSITCACGWVPDWQRDDGPFNNDEHIADAILAALVGFALRSAAGTHSS